MIGLRNVSLVVGGLLALTASMASAPAFAAGECLDWNVAGSWHLRQSNGTEVTLRLQQTGTHLQGVGEYSHYNNDTHKVQTIGGPVDGSLEHGGVIRLTVFWSNSTAGHYTGQVEADGGMTGYTVDQNDPSNKATFRASGYPQCVSRAAAAPSAKPTMALGRVQSPAGTPAATAGTICEAAASARARNSPAAPGLERQCAASKPTVQLGRVPEPTTNLGRVKPPPVQLGRVAPSGAPATERSICEAAADARARKSPAADGLERQCRESGGVAAAAPGGAPKGPGQGGPVAVLDGGPGDVTISRIYGGGGPGGVLAYDFVELRNRGSDPVSVDGWSIQYASATGASWAVVPLSGFVAPDEIYLLVAGSPNAPPVPADTTTAVQLSARSGKVALVRSTRPLEGVCPKAAESVVDFVGYGAANCFLGGSPAAPGALDLALVRAQDGCADTRENSADLTALAVEPLDRAARREACVLN